MRKKCASCLNCKSLLAGESGKVFSPLGSMASAAMGSCLGLQHQVWIPLYYVVPVAEDTMHLRHRTWKNLAGSDLEPWGCPDKTWIITIPVDIPAWMGESFKAPPLDEIYIITDERKKKSVFSRNEPPNWFNQSALETYADKNTCLPSYSAQDQQSSERWHYPQ